MGQPFLFSVIDKAMYDYNMIEKNDRILVAASGGKDSSALVEYFSLRQRRTDIPFEWKALHVETEITKKIDERLLSLFSKWNVQVENRYVEVLGRLKSGRTMNCFWCSMQRRNELLIYAKENGYNKVALGHHLDDILETLLMNMLNKGQLSTMIPRLKLDNFPVTIIRPLCYAAEETIIAHAKEAGYISTTCTCTYQENSGRKDARRKLAALTDGNQKKKEMLFKSLKNICPEYLP